MSASLLGPTGENNSFWQIGTILNSWFWTWPILYTVPYFSLSSISYPLQRQFQTFSSLLWPPTLFLLPSLPEADVLISYFPERIDSIRLPDLLFPTLKLINFSGGFGTYPFLLPSCFNGESFQCPRSYSGHLSRILQKSLTSFFFYLYYLPSYWEPPININLLKPLLSWGKADFLINLNPLKVLTALTFLHFTAKLLERAVYLFSPACIQHILSLLAFLSKDVRLFIFCH